MTFDLAGPFLSPRLGEKKKNELATGSQAFCITIIVVPVGK